MYSHEEEDSEARYVVLVQRGTLEDEFGRKLSALDPDALPSYAGPAEEQPWEASRDEVARWRGEHAARTVRRIGKTFAYLACPPLGLTLDLLESAGADAPLDEVTGELMRDERAARAWCPDRRAGIAVSPRSRIPAARCRIPDVSFLVPAVVY